MKITFTQGTLYTTLKFHETGPTQIDAYLAAIRVATSARPSGYTFMPAYKRGTWDGYVRLYKNGRFPSGLLWHVSAAILEQAGPNAVPGIDPMITVVPDPNERPLPYISDYEQRITPEMLPDITLRDYQIKAVRRLITRTRGVAKMATNSGKTEVMAAIAKLMPGKTIILTTKKDLLYQTRDRLEMRLREPVGAVGDSGWSEGRVTVAMIQTLAKHLDNLRGLDDCVDCVMFDECHHVPSTQAQEVLMRIPAHYRYGFSGTPLRYDELSDLVLIGATGPVEVEVTNADLIEAGVSAMPYVDMHIVHTDKGFKDSWEKSYTNYIVNNDNRNAIITHAAKEAGAQATLILVDRLEHGRKLQSLIPNSIFAHGSLPAEERKAILDRLRAGGGAVVIATPIFDEGVDVPSVDLLILAAGGETHIRLLQRIGRGMRRKDTNTLRVIDFVDDTNAYLLSHSKSRAELYEREGFAVRIVE